MTREELIETVNAASEASAALWEGAIEGAEREDDEHQIAHQKRAAEECAKHYTNALHCLRGGPGFDVESVLYSLRKAQRLELDSGDDHTAQAALSAVRCYGAAASRAVAV